IPQVTQATQEKFVPQMINFEVVGGVNFKKGCYPGQEIVARSQYLGKLKRRMMLATITAQEAMPGMDVFSSEDPEQPCGMIVNAERNSENETACLVEIKTATLENSSIHLGVAQGPTLRFQALPYALPDPE
ncbi:MAG: CAF17-like 4Fe-4S cluster assembly/insertion protein YgfZ, partial [Burkholderiaceae bacterium]